MELIYIFLGFFFINSASVSEVIGCTSHVGILRLAAGKVANYFSSPGNENCTWLIIASNPNEVVRIDFEDIEEDPSCSLGGISIYDGSTFDTERLGISCGEVERAFESSGRYMLVSLEKTNSSRSFRAKYYMFTSSVSSSNVASVVGGIIGALIFLSLGTTIVCTLKTHNMIPSLLPTQRVKNCEAKVRKESVSHQQVPKVSVVVPSSDYTQPSSYPVALQASSNTRYTHSYPSNPSPNPESAASNYSTFLANKTFTSTRSILSPSGYISAPSSSFENFD